MILTSNLLQGAARLDICLFKPLNSSSFFSPGARHIHLSGTGGKAASKNAKEREEERREWGHDDEKQDGGGGDQRHS